MATSSKRKRENENYNEKLPICKYGEKCYQKNPLHLTKFRHPHREQVEIEDISVANLSSKNSKLMECPPSQSNSESNFSLINKPALTKSCEIDNHQGSSTSQPLHAVGDDIDELPPSPMDIKENIKQKYLFDMPEDFYQLWEFCKYLKPENPQVALKEALTLTLVGPYQILDRSVGPKSRNLSSFLTEWRFYYDPPEFQTIMIGDLSDGFHLGYFRDETEKMPAFVGSNTESKGCTITPVAENVFAALWHLSVEKLKHSDPFQKTKVVAIRKSISDWTSKHEIMIQPVHGEKMKKRMRKVVAKTFFKCGMVVPYNQKTQLGYREIPENEQTLKKILKNIIDNSDSPDKDKYFDPLQELVNNVQYANDELDWGMGLELGWDLLAFGGEPLHSTIIHLLGVAYELLGRPQFFTILKAHLKNRRHLSSSHRS